MKMELLGERFSARYKHLLDRLLNAALRAADPKELASVLARFVGIELYHRLAILPVFRTGKSGMFEIFPNSYWSFSPRPTRTYARN
jgi:hypothetical protein